MKQYELHGHWLAYTIDAEKLGAEIRARLQQEGIVLQVQIDQVGSDVSVTPKDRSNFV